MENITQTLNTKHKSTILVYDLDCVAAVMYHLHITSSGIFKDHKGSYYTAFTYDASTLAAIESYEKGLLKINAQGYGGFYEDIMQTWCSELDFFERSNDDESL